jgi:hypothetical protein
MEFRGKVVNVNNKGYPRVYWPEHPVSNSGGQAMVHRIIAYEKYGSEIFSNDVHHVDGNKLNWKPENLELLSHKDHANLHLHPNAATVIRQCEECKKELSLRSQKRYNSEKVFCSIKCSSKHKEKINWPSNDELREKLAKSNYVQVGKELGVSDNAIRKRLRNNAM